MGGKNNGLLTAQELTTLIAKKINHDPTP